MRLYEDPSLKTQVQRTENELMRDKVLPELDEDLSIAMDEKGRNVALTEKGRDALSPGGARACSSCRTSPRSWPRSTPTTSLSTADEGEAEERAPPRRTRRRASASTTSPRS